MLHNPPVNLTTANADYQAMPIASTFDMIKRKE